MTQPPPEPPAGTAVGPLAQEAAMLLDVVADRLEQLKSGPAAPPADTSTDSQPGAHSSTPGEQTPGEQATGAQATGAQPTGAQATGEQALGDQHAAAAGPAGRCPECGSVPGAYCTACPLCRFIALLRGERPEATARLVDGALMIIRTLRSMVPEPGDPPHQHPHSPGPHPAQTQSHAGHPYPPARSTGLEHINIL